MNSTGTPTGAASGRAAALDHDDRLAAYRDRFVGAGSPLTYFDGNSLGRPLATTVERMGVFVEHEWGGRLIRGWDEQWMELPLVVGDELGLVCLGAAPGQVVVADSTTVVLYKLLRAAVAARPDRTEIVVDTDNFPTDRYVAEAVARECGLRLRWVETDPAAGLTLDQAASVVGPETAVVLASHVAYRSAYVADVPGITALAHEAGALTLWDLSHSVGSVPVELDAWDVDLAVGCTYKYVNGGPGSPAFGYVAARHLPELDQPVSGWMGHADPFAMGPGHTPDPGVRRLLSGTPPVLAMQPMRDMLALLAAVGMPAVREKSVGLTSYAIELADELLAPLGVELASPREAGRRGGHLTLTHPRMREVVAALWKRDVIPDYRDPGGLRIGLSPLSTSYDEVRRGIEEVAALLR
ncbi:aminotransferase class V-fold PLP-dependent enzyme [uncultured Nocardioides sp.]|uniref:kynureninase n=1 Tax=uncultured Nocardioides sp. TaxID=198441 RepID=UPI00263647FA|nr:aminotransferase class V-fold PLP-dependent enzyme [uncultured Nocardioides sp.]